ncbi:MAG: hypothetical protein CSA44_01060 [Gammaproteobacteria bacterium]|nr:MAG: hypothetical protein CSA44_01060 [Gammaproteobacteria bacterium]
MLALFVYFSHKNSFAPLGELAQLRGFLWSQLFAGVWFITKHFSSFLKSEKSLPKVSSLEVLLWGATIVIFIFPLLHSLICLLIITPLALLFGEFVFIPFANIDTSSSISAAFSSFSAYLSYLGCCSYAVALRLLYPQHKNNQVLAIAGGFFTALILCLLIVKPDSTPYFYFLEDASYQVAENISIRIFNFIVWVAVPVLAWVAALLALNNHRKRNNSYLPRVLLSLSFALLLSSTFFATELSKQIKHVDHQFSESVLSPNVNANMASSLYVTQWEDAFPSIEVSIVFSDKDSVQITASKSKDINIKAAKITQKGSKLHVHVGKDAFVRKKIHNRPITLTIYLPRHDWAIHCSKASGEVSILNVGDPIKLTTKIAASDLRLVGYYDTVSAWLSHGRRKPSSLILNRVNIKRTLNLYAKSPIIEVYDGDVFDYSYNNNFRITTINKDSSIIKNYAKTINLYGDESPPITEWARDGNIVDENTISSSVKRHPLSEKDRKELPANYQIYYW